MIDDVVRWFIAAFGAMIVGGLVAVGRVQQKVESNKEAADQRMDGIEKQMENVGAETDNKILLVYKQQGEIISLVRDGSARTEAAIVRLGEKVDKQASDINTQILQLTRDIGERDHA